MKKGPENIGFRIFSAVFFLLVFCAADLQSSFAGDKKPVSPAEIEKLDRTKAPDFTLKDLNGRTVPFAAFKGKVVLLNFWASWCPPCLAEMPSFKKLHSELKSRGLEVIAVSTDRSAGETKGYTDKKGFEFTILMDTDRTVSRQYKVFSLPTTFLIDKNGVIVEKFFGEYDWTDRDIRKQIEKLL